MKNFIQPGDALTVAAPAGGVVSGGGYQIGQQFLVAEHDAAAGAQFTGCTEGVFDLPKAANDAPAAGALIYWDPVNQVATVVAAGFLCIGAATMAAAGADATVRVRLNGVAQANHA